MLNGLMAVIFLLFTHPYEVLIGQLLLKSFWRVSMLFLPRERI